MDNSQPETLIEGEKSDFQYPTTIENTKAFTIPVDTDLAIQRIDPILTQGFSKGMAERNASSPIKSSFMKLPLPRKTSETRIRHNTRPFRKVTLPSLKQVLVYLYLRLFSYSYLQSIGLTS